MRFLRFHSPFQFFVLLGALGSVAGIDVDARPAKYEFTEPMVEADEIGDFNGTTRRSTKAAVDTIWIADWSHDTGAVCSLNGWEKVDNRVFNDGMVYWDTDPAFAGQGGITGTAAALGYEGDACCVDLDGYGNDWYQAMRIEYAGGVPAHLSFDYLIDSEAGFDFLQVEDDSGCASFDLVDYSINPSRRYGAASFRTLLFSRSGITTGTVSALELTDHGPGTHCVYIAFTSDGAFSPCDGLQSTTIGKAVVIDNIAITDGGGNRNEDFEDGTLEIGTFVNILDSEPFGPTLPGRDGSWARTYLHITDNDFCTENTTCALLWTDDVTPSIAVNPSMAFGPGGYVVKNWLDDIVISPWVSLVSTPNATGTIVQFRRFPGNFFSTSRMVQNWSIRAKADEDDGMGGSVECISGWGHAFQFNSLSVFGWITPGFPSNSGFDASSDFDPTAKEIQIRHRTTDWQFIVGSSPPRTFNPGPGPYIDRTRIGRITLAGPVLDEGIDARSQAQDAFATEIHPGVTPAGEHHRPTTDRFGTVALSRGLDLANHSISTNLVTGDSIHVEVEDVRGAGGVVRVEFYGAITSGPHAGLAPPPHVVGSNGFFIVTADSARTSNGAVVKDHFFIDLDDEYFVGGDALAYFWLAEDALGGFGSNPSGLTQIPASFDGAQAATDGLFEFNALPTIEWDADLLAAVQVDNKVNPNSDPAFLDASFQRSCVLYVNRINSRRRTGGLNRTSFMYTLDVLGYADDYDVYDHQGMGNTNNHLGGRATIEQAEGYSLIVYDAGNVGPGGTIMPDGLDLDAEKIDQASWFRSWLDQASVSEAGWATLWVIGSNVVEEKPTNPLYTGHMRANLAATNQGVSLNPDVEGQTSFAFDAGEGSPVVDFTVGPRARFSVNGGCPNIRHYDGLSASGTGVDVYRYADPFTTAVGDAAIVMNSNPTGNWNTILQSHPWFDIREEIGLQPNPPTPAEDLLSSVLVSVLPTSCVNQVSPTDLGDPDATATPKQTQLFQNAPNPFNPTTTIRFDLASDGPVRLQICNVAGRHVRTLVDATLTPGRGIEFVWDGIDAHGQRVASGLYFYRLDAPSFSATRKMMLMK